MYSSGPGFLGGFGIFILIVYFLINTILTGWLADKKGYSMSTWALLAFFFGPFVLLTLGFAPDLNTEATLNDIKNKLDSLNIDQTPKVGTKPDSKRQSTATNNENQQRTVENKKLPENFSDFTLLNKTQFDQLTQDAKSSYKTKIIDKIDVETDETIKQLYYKNLFDLGYLYYGRFIEE